MMTERSSAWVGFVDAGAVSETMVSSVDSTAKTLPERAKLPLKARSPAPKIVINFTINSSN